MEVTITMIMEIICKMHGKRCHIWFDNEDGTMECFDMLMRLTNFSPDSNPIYADASVYRPAYSDYVVKLEGRLLDFKADDWKKLVEQHFE